METDAGEYQKIGATLRKLTMAVEQSPESIVVTDTSGTIEYVNPMFTEVTGYTASEAVGQNPRVLKSGKMPECVYAELWGTITAGRTWRGELYNRKKNGDYYWESASISPVRDDAGRITHFVAVKLDITDRKLAEEALRRSEAHLALSQKIACLGSYELSQIQGRDDWSDELFRILGVKRGEVKPSFETFLSLVHPEDRAEARARAIDLIKNEGPGYEFRILRPDGQIRWIRSEGQVLPDASGKPVLMCGTLQDITERKRAEELLRESEEKFRLTFDRSPIGAVIASPDFRFQKANAEFCHLTGYSEQELAGLSFPEITFEADRGSTVELAKKLAAGDIPMYEMDKRYVRKDGGIIWVRITCRLMRDAGGSPLYYLAMAVDITARRQAEEALRRKNRELGLINAITATLNSSLSLGEKLQKVLADALDLASADAGAIYLADEDPSAEMVLAAAGARTTEGRQARSSQIVKPGWGTESQPAAAAKIAGELFGRQGFASLVPFAVNGQAIGLLALYYGPETLDQEVPGELPAICSQVGIAVENHRLFKKIEDTSRYLADIIDESPDPIMTVDTRGTILSFNKRAACLLKYPPAEMIGASISRLLPVGQLLDMSLKGSYVRDFVCKDGTSVTLSVSTARIHRDGAKPGNIITLKDLSAITGFRVVPLTEKPVDTDQLYHLEAGAIYLFDRSRYGVFMNVFADQVKHHIQGLCITRHNPAKLRETSGLEKTPIVWLTGNEGVFGEICLKPDNLSGLSATVSKFIAEADNGLILLDGIEYLMMRNTYEALFKFIQFLHDRIMLSNCRVICCADPAAFDQRQYSLLATEMEAFQGER